MSQRTLFLKILLPLLVLGVGALGMVAMIKAKQEPRQSPPLAPGALVEVVSVQPQARTVAVRATGTVQPRREIQLTPQVSGKVTWLAPQLLAGGFFAAGDELLRIEPLDYQLAVDRARAALAKAEVELATVEGQAEVARLEWERLKLAGDQPPSPLVLYQPQLKNARASLASARASLRQAELDLERTVLRAPFACRVRSEQVDVGQYLRAGSAVAVLAGTASAEVVVPLPVSELAWLRIPGPGRDGNGSPATVRFAADGRSASWSGRIVRALGEVDPLGRMTRVVVAVADPYGLQAPGGPLPLETGLFVEVTLHGSELPAVFVIPRRALREGNLVWVADDADQLRLQSVEVLRLERDEALIGAGLQPGDRVVLTTLSGAADGMRLRVQAKEGA